VGAKAKATLEEISEAVSPAHHSARYRQLVKSVGPPGIPNLPTILNDLISIGTGEVPEPYD
jgi:hypothetical protein